MNDRGFSQSLLLIVLIIAIITIAFIVPTIRTKISIRKTWKGSFILTGLYLGVLILMVPLLTVLPDNNYIKLIENSDHDLEFTLSQDIFRDVDFVNHLTEESLNKHQGFYKISTQTFKANTNKLLFLLDDSFINGHYRIFVEQKDVDDGEIGVSTYATTQLAGGIDFTKLMLPPAISFQKGTLYFKSPSRQSLEFKQFKNDFTLDQFKLQNYRNSMGMSVNLGGKVIYIHIPKSLEIDKEMYSDDQIQMISGT